MIEKIQEKIEEKLNQNYTIYVLKGFNSIINKLNIKIEHIFDLKINESLLNIVKINHQEIIIDGMNKMSTGNSFYCLLEELIIVDRNNLMGIIQANHYKIKIIDIGCFEYYYPGFIDEKKEECLRIFDKEEPDNNLLQIVYTDFLIKNDTIIIAYNKIENDENIRNERLFDSYSNDYINKRYNIINSYEISDNSSPEMFIKIFNDVVNDIYNEIIYNIVEGKKDVYTEKLLTILNILGARIIRQKTKKEYDKPKLYDEYLKILKRKNPSYDFKNFEIYEDPFSSNKKVKINQSYIIDKIYQNVLRAQREQSFKDIFVTAPTGAGKSMLFQIPAIMAAENNELITIIISPLIGLMKDQVNNIKILTNCAETINSEYTPFEKDSIKDKVKNGKISILYISPETLLSNYDIKALIGERKIGLLVVDEAHTVATWGKNFRPDYWYLGDYLDRLRHRMGYSFPIATFTATATISNGNEDMYHDIVESLNLTCDSFFGNVKRDDIKFDIKIIKKDHSYQEEKDRTALDSIKKYIEKDEKTIVYFPYVKTLDEFYQLLDKKRVGRYYGSLDKLDKNETLEDIRFGNKKVVLATKAFGMGIDVNDIKNVYHFAPTGNLADYVQEIGRAARDPNMFGIASTDYYEEDFRYISRLYGLSQITTYEIIGVLMKILYIYRKENRRNFLVSVDDFAHVFRATDEEEIENKLKASLIAIKKDFKNMSNYIPLVFKPRSMFTSGMFYISDIAFAKVKLFGWEKYLRVKYDKDDIAMMSMGDSKDYLYGKIYELDFKRCWEDKYNGKYDGITFGNFKRMFYADELKNVDRTCFSDRMVLELESKYGDNFEIIVKKTEHYLYLLQSVIEDMKMSQKHYNIEEITKLLCAKDQNLNYVKIHSIINPLINLIIVYNINTFGKYSNFCDYNNKTDRYHISSSYFYRAIRTLIQALENQLNGFEDSKSQKYLIDVSKNKNKNMRLNPMLVTAQIMELLDVATYTCSMGDKPEFFVRVNSEKTIQKVLNDKKYRSRTLDNIQKMHYDSIRYMKYFFEVLKTDEKRWEFIEDYFLGNISNKYDIPSISKTGVKRLDDDHSNNKVVNNSVNLIKIYAVFNTEEKLTYQYYISKDKIDFFENKGFSLLNPLCELAIELSKHSTGDVFDINGYEYLVEKVDYYDI